VLVAVALLPLLFAILYFWPPWTLVLAISAVSGMAVYELLSVSKFVKQPRVIAYGCLFAAFIPITYYFDFSGIPNTLPTITFAVLLFAEGMHDPERVTFPMIGVTFFACLVFPSALCSALRVIDLEWGRFVILLVFIPAFLTDIFAMFAGLAFGKHRLAPVISPKKSVEGAIAGLLASVFFCCAYGVILQTLFDFHVNYIALAVMGLVASAAGQFGDLAMSYVKRCFGVKDFGGILLGHGGILDRFDSLFFAAPIVEMFLTLRAIAPDPNIASSIAIIWK
jgi:phosphatidate cytidylyltransferase